MEVARTSMIHAAAPQFLWPFAVGDASRFRVWGARAFVRDTTADKLSPRAIPCIFLGFVPDAHGWQFYDPASRRVFASHDVTFDESVPFYRLFPYHTAPRPLPLLFLAPGPPWVTGDSGPATGGAVPGGAELGGVHRGGAESGGAGREGLAGTERGGAEPACEEPGGPTSGGAASGGAASGGAASGGAASGGAALGGAEPACVEPGGAESGGESREGPETAVTRSPWSSRLRARVPLTS
ncbi:unnamed protein product [Closterium sp. NIES-64]|nr:unnamed protein product [Closterium sp. NIES-64]